MRPTLLTFIIAVFLSPSIGCAVESATPACSFTVNVSAPPPAGWVLVEKGRFWFYIPSSMLEQEVQGVDSQVWEYKSDTVRLDIDYGRYSGFPETVRREKSFSQEIWCVNRKKALVCTYEKSAPDQSNLPESTRKKVMGMFFLTEKVKPAFWLEVATDDDINVARQILQTVRFGN